MMNRAAPWNSNNVQLDVREAARHAARREGLSVEEWLDTIVAKRAAETGVNVADLTADERLDAVTEQLMRLARDRPQMSRSAERILANFEVDRRRTRSGARSDSDTDMAAAPHIAGEREILDMLKPSPRAGREALDASGLPEAELPAQTVATGRFAADPGPESLAQSRLGAADLRMSVEDGVRSWDRAPASPPAAPADNAEGGMDPVDQMGQVEAKLTALFRALDRTPDRSVAPPARASDELEAASQRLARATPDGGAEPAAPQRGAAPAVAAPSLEQAIAEIAQRQAFLDRAEAAAPSSAEPSVAADLLERFGVRRNRRQAASVKDVHLPDQVVVVPPPLAAEQAAAEPPVPVPAVVPDAGLARVQAGPRIFKTLQTEIAGLASQLDSIHRDAAHRDAALARETVLAKDATVNEIRSMLGGLQPNRDLNALEERVEALTTRIDSAIENRLKPAAIDELAQRIEAVQASVKAGMARPVTPVVDTAPMEHMLAGLAAGVQTLRERSVDGVTLDGMMARLSAKLDTVPTKEMLTRLTDSVETMRERSVDAVALDGMMARLSAKLDTVPTKEVITRLAASVETIEERSVDIVTLDAMMGELSARLDTAPMEHMLTGLVASVETMRERSVDAAALDGMMTRLSAKLDAARQPQADAAIFADLQAQLAKLAEKIDRSEEGLGAIVSVERSLGELFSQLEETREAAINAAETAARTAARDTLRAAMMDTSLPINLGQGSADAAVLNVTQQISDLRATREKADDRLQSMLTALNKTLEKVVDRLTAAEDHAEVARQRNSGAAARAAAEALPVLDLAESGAKAARADQAVEPLERSAEVSVGAVERPPAGVDLDEADFPIEPGSAAVRPRIPRRQLDTSDDSGQAADVKTDPAQFIAAARRAAQESMNRASAAKVRTTEVSAQDDDSLASQARTYIAARRRPLLLALAGLVLLLGAVQVTRLNMFGSPTAPKVAIEVPASEPEAAKTPEAPLASPETPAPAADTSTAAADDVPTITKAPEPAAVPADSHPATVVQTSAPASAPLDPVKPLPTLAMGFGGNRAARPAAPGPESGLPAGLVDRAQGGDAAAQYEVGLRLADGRGVTRDLKEAADWFEKSAKQGLAPAAYRLGSLYEKGLGVTRNPALSIQWYQTAADKGNVRAMHNLAVMSAEGAAGPSDYAKAATWFTKAAQSGVRDSQFNLAILYARGLGIEQNLGQSYTWFSIAADQGDTDAAKKRDEVAARLDPKALASAKAAAAQFGPTAAVPAANEVPPPPGGWDAVAPKTPGAGAGASIKSDHPRISNM